MGASAADWVWSARARGSPCTRRKRTVGRPSQHQDRLGEPARTVADWASSEMGEDLVIDCVPLSIDLVVLPEL